MNVIYHDRVRQWKEVYVLLQRATKNLEEILEGAAETVTAEWDRAEDSQGHLLPTLRLSDTSGSVTAIFSPDELDSVSHLRIRLNLLWADLAQIRSTKQLQELLTGSGQGDQ
jgi:hypothetical protein